MSTFSLTTSFSIFVSMQNPYNECYSKQLAVSCKQMVSDSQLSCMECQYSIFVSSRPFVLKGVKKLSVTHCNILFIVCEVYIYMYREEGIKNKTCKNDIKCLHNMFTKSHDYVQILASIFLLNIFLTHFISTLTCL